jgi:YggT family protein
VTDAVLNIVLGLIQIVNLLVIVWCLLSWFPNIRWYDQPFKSLDMVVQPMIAPFRKLIPPIGNIDFSPMIALFVLNGLSMLLRNFVH